MIYVPIFVFVFLIVLPLTLFIAFVIQIKEIKRLKKDNEYWFGSSRLESVKCNEQREKYNTLVRKLREISELASITVT